MANRGKELLSIGRRMRLAVGMRCVGYPDEAIAAVVDPHLGEVDWLIKLAVERVGFASNGGRFDGTIARFADMGVYALGGIGAGVVKVGWSEAITQRIRHVSVPLPIDTVLLGKICFATIKHETALHKEMDKWHKKGEWFYFTATSRQFIESRFSIQIPDDVAAAIGIQEDR